MTNTQQNTKELRDVITSVTKFDDYTHSSYLQNKGYKLKIYASALPFCPILGFIEGYAQHRVSGTHPINESNFSRAFYADIGTEQHAIIQRYMGFSQQIVGWWKCTRRECEHELTKDVIPKPLYCPKCNHRSLDYKEVKVHYPNENLGVPCKIDGLFLDKKGRLWIIDYKFTSEKKLDPNGKERAKLPDKKHVMQQMTYIVALRKAGIDIYGYHLVYLNRASPFFIAAKNMYIHTCIVSEKAYNGFVVWLNNQIKMLGFARNAVIKVNGETMKGIVENKPCCDREFYLKNYKDDYNPCALGDSGLCFSKKRELAIAAKGLADDRLNELKTVYDDFCKPKDI